MKQIFNRIKTVANVFALIFVVIFLIGCVVGPFTLLPNIWNLYFHEVKNYSVWELRNEKRTIEAKVSGNLDKIRYLTEEKGLTENSKKLNYYYYYYLYSQGERTINGIYVYSPLPPEEFMKQYGTNPVTLHGIWEERSPILEHPPPATLAEQVYGEMDKSFNAYEKKYKKKNLVGEDVTNALKEFPPVYKVPIEPKYSLNLTPVQPYKQEKLFELAIASGFCGYILLSAFRGYRKRKPDCDEKIEDQNGN